MNQDNKTWYLRGLRDGMPIMLGYAAVGFTLGIAARNAGLTAFQAGLASLLNNASAGEKAGFTVIEHNEGYLAMAIMMLIINARYLLMSCSLSQKISPKTGLIPRLIIGFEVTDEIFGVQMNVPGMINAMTDAIQAAGINLANITSKARGSVAYTLIDLDTALDDGAINKIGQAEGVIRVRAF